MADQKDQSGEGVVTKDVSGQIAQKGHQPVAQDGGDTGLAGRTDAGYQPSRGNLDVTNPPKGGSGVPKAPAGESSSDKSE
jgi:hypothetical protein